MEYKNIIQSYSQSDGLSKLAYPELVMRFYLFMYVNLSLDEFDLRPRVSTDNNCYATNHTTSSRCVDDDGSDVPLRAHTNTRWRTFALKCDQSKYARLPIHRHLQPCVLSLKKTSLYSRSRGKHWSMRSSVRHRTVSRTA